MRKFIYIIFLLLFLCQSLSATVVYKVFGGAELDSPGDIGTTTPGAGTFTEVTVQGSGDAYIGFDNNTSLTGDYTGKYTLLFDNGVLKKHVNGVLSEVGSGVSVISQTSDPTATDSTGFYLNTTDGDFFYVNQNVGVSTWTTTYTPAATCASDSVDVSNESTSTGSSAAQSAAYGNSFQCSAGSLSAIGIYVTTTTGAEIEVRWGTSSDLTTTYESTTLTIPSDGDAQWHKATFTNKVTVSASTTYYYGYVLNSGSVSVGYSGNDYANGELIYAGSSGWNMSSTLNADFLFRIYLCD